ncbi:MAG: ABC transporter substrate-binding protein [Candidatus Aminicenantes bacterium]|nr:ABC transporter substrate-binding protein [Candidatus Aminicenantes bacterium]
MAKSACWIWLLACGTAQAAAQASAPGPLEAVRSSNERVRSILAGRETIDPHTEEALFAAIDEATDIGLISRRATEAFRSRLTGAEYAELDGTFRELLRKSSLRKLGRYRADRFEYVDEEIRGDTALVRTMAFYEAESVRLDYRMERIAGRWMIVDYIVDDVETVRNYRKQFIRLFAANDTAGVIRRLKAKIAEIDEERGVAKDPGAERR